MTLLTAVKKAGRTMESRISGSPAPDEQADTDILDTLKKEHDEAKKLLTQLVDSKSSAERKSLLKKVKAALVPHLRAEEKVLYDAIIALKDKEAKQDGEEGYLEHGLGDKMLATLGKISNAMSPEFSAAAKVLKELVEHHVEEEERDVWAEARKNFSEEKRVAMNRAFLAAKKKVRVS
jgi:hemerythrin-like domain-containing protein